ncbi:hypothetical protein ACFXDH_37495 [Streptomyces sp. NPDC059467]
MNETTPEGCLPETAVLQTSDEKAWQGPGRQVAETAPEVTGYTLGDR